MLRDIEAVNYWKRMLEQARPLLPPLEEKTIRHFRTLVTTGAKSPCLRGDLRFYIPGMRVDEYSLDLVALWRCLETGKDCPETIAFAHHFRTIRKLRVLTSTPQPEWTFFLLRCMPRLETIVLFDHERCFIHPPPQRDVVFDAIVARIKSGDTEHRSMELSINMFAFNHTKPLFDNLQNVQVLVAFAKGGCHFVNIEVPRDIAPVVYEELVRNGVYFHYSFNLSELVFMNTSVESPLVQAIQKKVHRYTLTQVHTKKYVSALSRCNETLLSGTLLELCLGSQKQEMLKISMSKYWERHCYYSPKRRAFGCPFLLADLVIRTGQATHCFVAG